MVVPTLSGQPMVFRGVIGVAPRHPGIVSPVHFPTGPREVADVSSYLGCESELLTIANYFLGA